MKIAFNSQNFKGYDALPLRAIHIQDRAADAFFWELEEIAKKEGFEVPDYLKDSEDIFKIE